MKVCVARRPKVPTDEVWRRRRTVEIGHERRTTIAQNVQRGAIQNEIRKMLFRHHEQKSDEGQSWYNCPKLISQLCKPVQGAICFIAHVRSFLRARLFAKMNFDDTANEMSLGLCRADGIRAEEF